MTVVIIDLDYDASPIATCRKVWSLIEKRMSQAGFVKYNRLFVSNADSATAFARARDVMQGVDKEYRDQGEDILQCVREFYGIPGVPFSHIVDLVQPSAHEITVDFLAVGTFQKLFPGYS